MLIGELSRKSGFTRDTIRFYEKLGLIVITEDSRRENSYKEYPDGILKRLLAIKKIKDYGFTLEETRNMFILFEEGVLEPQRGKKYVQRKITRIDKKIEELQLVKKRLQEVAEEGRGDCALHKILVEGVC
jgi:MerR family copper efflux transcriptional regulator